MGFYNDSASVAEAATKFQTGSIFEETGTSNIYHLDSVGWKQDDSGELTNHTLESMYEQLTGETP